MRQREIVGVSSSSSGGGMWIEFLVFMCTEDEKLEMIDDR